MNRVTQRAAVVKAQKVLRAAGLKIESLARNEAEGVNFSVGDVIYGGNVKFFKILSVSKTQAKFQELKSDLHQSRDTETTRTPSNTLIGAPIVKKVMLHPSGATIYLPGAILTKWNGKPVEVESHYS